MGTEMGNLAVKVRHNEAELKCLLKSVARLIYISKGKGLTSYQLELLLADYGLAGHRDGVYNFYIAEKDLPAPTISE